MNSNVVNFFQPAVTAMKSYHNHQVFGLNHIIPGRVLLVVNHSLATYDILMLFYSILEHHGRFPRALADRLFFKIPFMDQLVNAAGGIKGAPAGAKRLLQQEHIVAVAPGGMREALRPSKERYQINWGQRTGFVKLAIKTQTPIVIAVCPQADDIYNVYQNPLTPWAYRKYRVPIILARGFGPTLLPKPVKLVHYLSQPIIPPNICPSHQEFPKAVKTLHRSLIKKTQTMINEALAIQP